MAFLSTINTTEAKCDVFPTLVLIRIKSSGLKILLKIGYLYIHMLLRIQFTALRIIKSTLYVLQWSTYSNACMHAAM